METTKLKVHFTAEANPYPVLRAHKGYISEFIVHGIGPNPGAKAAIYKTRETLANQAYLYGHAWCDHVTEISSRLHQIGRAHV